MFLVFEANILHNVIIGEPGDVDFKFGEKRGELLMMEGMSVES